MKQANLNDMINGWFVGNFEPTLLKTNDIEVAVKRYKKVTMKRNTIIKLQLKLQS